VAPVLVIQLTRFKGSRYHMRKYSTPVTLTDELDVTGFMIEGSEKPDSKYRLSAVSNHFGRINGGHFMGHALVQNPFEGLSSERKWYSFGDARASESTASEAHDGGAYTLSHERLTDPAD
jgi:ubiquitin carboxyl-terminal hydrolase 4/11/15